MPIAVELSELNASEVCVDLTLSLSTFLLPISLHDAKVSSHGPRRVLFPAGKGEGGRHILSEFAITPSISLLSIPAALRDDPPGIY